MSAPTVEFSSPPYFVLRGLNPCPQKLALLGEPAHWWAEPLAGGAPGEPRDDVEPCMAEIVGPST